MIYCIFIFFPIKKINNLKPDEKCFTDISTYISNFYEICLFVWSPSMFINTHMDRLQFSFMKPTLWGSKGPKMTFLVCHNAFSQLWIWNK